MFSANEAPKGTPQLSPFLLFFVQGLWQKVSVAPAPASVPRRFYQALRMKQRNHLLALVLFLLFVGSGVVYFRAYAKRKPFGIILFVGEGLTSSRLTAARLYAGGADQRLVIQALPNVALLSTFSADFAVPDAASAASALACGAKVNNRALATDPSGQKRGTLLELARQKGRATGLVTNARLTDPTPAAFYAHAADDRERAPLAEQLAAAGLDVMLGGGRADFEGMPNGRRRDGRNLVQEMIGKGYRSLLKASDLAPDANAALGPKLLGLFAADGLTFGGETGAEGTQPRLSEMVRAAIETLQKRAGGYVLVVDAGLIGKASVADDGEHVLQETLELDRAVELALQYAGEKTLVIVAGGESTGGLALNGYPLRKDHGVSLLGMNAVGLPSLTWSTGPMGAVGAAAAVSPTPMPAEPAAFAASYAANVADDAVAAGFGPGSERLRGFLDNTFVFELIKGQL